MTFYQDLRIKTRPQLKKNGKLKRKHYITDLLKIELKYEVFDSFFSYLSSHPLRGL